MSDGQRKNLPYDSRRRFTMANGQDDFLFDVKQTKKIMRKARFWSTIKIIGIATIVTPIILLVLWYGLRTISIKNAYKVMDDIRLFNLISGPNVQISNQVYDDHLFGGKIKTTTYKVLGDENRPYIWEPIESEYNLFGSHTRNYVFSSIQMESSGSLEEANQIERFNDYTGDREMFFYHPEVTYDNYKDDLAEVAQFEEDTLVELGISFDKAYSFEEIKSMLPTEVQTNWWWVNAFTSEGWAFMKQGKGTVSANSPFIYGFHSEQSRPTYEQYQEDEIETFIQNLEKLRESKNFEWETDQVYQSLIGDNGTLDLSDVKIIGAVVTGTPEQLKTLEGQTYIKSSTFGVISDRK